MDKGRLKTYIGAGAIALLAIVAAIVWHARGRPKDIHPLTVGNASFTIELPESGVVQYPQIQTISAQISGNVGHIFVKTGQRVQAGELLATIVNPEILANAAGSSAAYRAATARSQSAAVTGTSNVAQAEANLEAARARLAQAQQDYANGIESNPASGATTAAEQRAQADANLATAQTDLNEARRVYLAYTDLYANKAVSRDQLDKARAKYDQTQAAYRQASIARTALGTVLTSSRKVLADNLRSAQQGVAEAQAALATARVESGPGDVAAAAAEAARAGSEYALAQEQADATQIRAPYDAVVLGVEPEKSGSLRPLQPGDAIVVGQPLITLTARRAFVVRTRVDEQDVINVRLGERVEISGEDFPGRELDGRVVEISPIAEKASDTAASGTVETTVAIDRPPSFLRDGMSVDVEIFTTDLAHAIVVPNEAIEHDGATRYVYVVRDFRAHRQPVRLGPANETDTVIVAGLRDGDVIAENAGGLHDGVPVEYV